MGFHRARTGKTWAAVVGKWISNPILREIMLPYAIPVEAPSALTGGVGAQSSVLVNGVIVGVVAIGGSTATYSSKTGHATTATDRGIQIRYGDVAPANGQDERPASSANGVNAQPVGVADSLEARHGHGEPIADGATGDKLPAIRFALPRTRASPAFYVSTSGSDGGDGTAAHPFATLTRAVSAMEQSGTRMTYLKGGNYYLNATIKLGSIDSGFTIKSAPGSAAVLDGKGELSTLIQLDNVTGITLQGLTFQHTGGDSAALVLTKADSNNIAGNLFSHTGEGLLLSDGSGGNVVSGNEFDSSSTCAVEVQNTSNHNRFDSNLVNGTGAIGTKGGGFFLHGANYNIISHNQVENTSGIGIGIENWDADTVNVGNIISDNILNNTNINPLSVDSGAIYLLGRSEIYTRTLISGNYITRTVPLPATDAHIVGIYLDDYTSGVSVSGNIVKDVITHALEIHGGFNVTIRNNIFDLGANSGLQYGKGSAVLFQSKDGTPMTGNSVSGNIIVSSSPTPLSYSSIDGGTPTIVNNFYMNPRSGDFRTNGDSISEINAHHGNARFKDQAAGNYAIGSKSGARATGFAAIDQTAMGLHPITAHWY
jgi:parallel beta-helix repeat protein